MFCKPKNRQYFLLSYYLGMRIFFFQYFDKIMHLLMYSFVKNKYILQWSKTCFLFWILFWNEKFIICWYRYRGLFSIHKAQLFLKSSSSIRFHLWFVTLMYKLVRYFQFKTTDSQKWIFTNLSPDWNNLFRKRIRKARICIQNSKNIFQISWSFSQPFSNI